MDRGKKTEKRGFERIRVLKVIYRLIRFNHLNKFIILEMTANAVTLFFNSTYLVNNNNKKQKMQCFE